MRRVQLQSDLPKGLRYIIGEVIVTVRLFWEPIYYVKWWWQRARRGWADCDLLNFDEYLAKLIVGSMTRFKTNHPTYPADMSAEEWAAKLDEIIAGFQAALAL